MPSIPSDLFSQFTSIAGPITVLLAALGLSSTAGLRAYLPLFAVGIASDFTNATGGQLVPLHQSFTPLGSPLALVVLGALAVTEFALDKIPLVDHISDLVHTVLRPLSGAIIMAGTANTLSNFNGWAAAIVGAALALGVHGMKAGTRHAVTATTIGTANPLVSLVEDVLAIGSVLLLIFLPVIGFIAVVILLILFLRLFRFIVGRVRRLVGGAGGQSRTQQRTRGAPAQVVSAAAAGGGGAKPKGRRGKRQIAAAKGAAGAVAGGAVGAAGVAGALGGIAATAARPGLPVPVPAAVVPAPGIPQSGAAAVAAPPTAPVTPNAPTVRDPAAPPFITARPLPQQPVVAAHGQYAGPVQTAPLPPSPYPADAPTLPGIMGAGQTATLPDPHQP